uniref:Groucho/TLE N-terminal Q-rich domain-containing protein n=2 Tax=Artiodactyla TaxID=91561 RepID=A0A4X1VS32_PIG
CESRYGSQEVGGIIPAFLRRRKPRLREKPVSQGYRACPWHASGSRHDSAGGFDGGSRAPSFDRWGNRGPGGCRGHPAGRGRGGAGARGPKVTAPAGPGEADGWGSAGLPGRAPPLGGAHGAREAAAAAAAAAATAAGGAGASAQPRPRPLPASPPLDNRSGGRACGEAGGGEGRGGAPGAQEAGPGARRGRARGEGRRKRARPGAGGGGGGPGSCRSAPGQRRGRPAPRAARVGAHSRGAACAPAATDMMFPQSRHSGSSHLPQQLKFTTSDSCDRIKDEFQLLQAQYHSLKLECDKLASEKSEMQRHYVMAEIVKRLNGICAQVLPYLSQEHQQQVLGAIERAKQVTAPELNSIIRQQLQAHQLSQLQALALPLTPLPVGLQPPSLPAVSAGTGLLSLSALGSQAHLSKEDKNGHDGDTHQEDDGEKSD